MNSQDNNGNISNSFIIGVKYGADDNVSFGPIHFSGLALSAIVGVGLNAVLPGKLGMKIKSVHGKEKK